MHGLKCAGAFPGWTRLCDEWLGSLARPWTRDGSMPWEHPGMPLRTVAEAVARTRSFASGVAEEPMGIAADGVLRFELQGVLYVVATAEWTPGADEDLVEGARERIGSLVEGARRAASADEHPVGLLLLAPRAPVGDASRARVEAWVEAFRAAELTHAMAYSFPPQAGGGEGAGFARGPGAFLLARSGVFG